MSFSKKKRRPTVTDFVNGLDPSNIVIMEWSDKWARVETDEKSSSHVFLVMSLLSSNGTYEIMVQEDNTTVLTASFQSEPTTSNLVDELKHQASES